MLKMNLEFKMDSSNHIAEINELIDKIASDIVSLNFTNSYKKEKQEMILVLLFSYTKLTK